MTMFKLKTWRAVLVLFFGFIIITNNTAMAMQMASSETHRMSSTQQVMNDEHMHHSGADSSIEKHSKSCVSQMCCFCLSYENNSLEKSVALIEAQAPLITPYNKNMAIGHFSTLYRPPA